MDNTLHLMKPCYILAAILIALTSTENCEGCTVHLSSQWEAYTYIPQGSTVHMKCTATNDGQSPFWSIKLRESENFRSFLEPFSKRFLNDDGFYEVRQDNSNTNGVLQMIINDTQQINETVIRCVDGGSLESPTMLETIIIVYSTRKVDVENTHINNRTINICWNGVLMSEINQSYTLTVTSSSSYKQTLQLYEPHYTFTVPDNSSQVCDVYNFSVTATPVGATYTGDGCSIPSPVLSRMLPSLPSADHLESSLNWCLQKQSAMEFILIISFMPLNDCPATEYFIEITGPTHTKVVPVLSTFNTFNVSLMASRVYSVRLTASRAEDYVSTGYTSVYTTDVQSVTAVPNAEGFTLQCTFAANSDALGCTVTVECELGNVTANLTRKNNAYEAIDSVKVPHNLSYYNDVFGHDLYVDGSVGIQTVPGVITTNLSRVAPCLQPTKSERSHINGAQLLTGTTVATITAVLVVVVATVTVSIVMVKRYKTTHMSSNLHRSNLFNMKMNEIYGTHSCATRNEYKDINDIQRVGNTATAHNAYEVVYAEITDEAVYDVIKDVPQ